jgi:hypothetical protein
MFKRPIKVELDVTDATLNHEINVSKNTHFYARNLIAQIGTTTIQVVACVALIKTSSEIIVHIAKTKI